MRETSSIRKKIVVNTVSMVMILSIVFLCILFLTSRIMTNLILLDVMQPLVRTASQAVEANLHVLSDRVFMISDNRVFTEAGTTKAEKQALLENAASQESNLYLCRFIRPMESFTHPMAMVRRIFLSVRFISI